MIENSSYLIVYENANNVVQSFHHKNTVDFNILANSLLKNFSKEKYVIELMNYEKDFDLIQDSEQYTNLKDVIIPLENYIEPESVITVNNKKVKAYTKSEEVISNFFDSIFPENIPVFIFTSQFEKWQIELNNKRMDLDKLLYLKDKYFKYLIYETQIEDYITIADPNYRPKMVTGDYKPLTWEDVKEKVWLIDFKRDKRCNQIITYLNETNDNVISEYFIAEHIGNWEHIKKSSDSYELYKLNKKLTRKYSNQKIKEDLKKNKI